MSSSDRQTINSNCIVIGGDITGLIIAQILHRQGIKVTVLDENRDIGGRLATCRISQDDSIEGVFDTGVQYFSVTNPQFQVWVDEWLKHGVGVLVKQRSNPATVVLMVLIALLNIWRRIWIFTPTLRRSKLATKRNGWWKHKAIDNIKQIC